MPDLSFVEFTDRLAQPFKVTSFTFNSANGLQHTNAFVQTDGDGNRVGLSATTPMFYRLTDGTNAYDARQIRALSSSTDSVGAVQTGSWSVAVSNLPSTYPLPQSQVDAITSSFSSGGGLTNTQLRASPVPVSASSLPLPTGAATEATLSAMSAKFGTLGQKAATGSAPVVLSTDQQTLIEAVVLNTTRTYQSLESTFNTIYIPDEIKFAVLPTSTYESVRIVGKLTATAATANTFRVVRPELSAVGINIAATAQTLTISSTSTADAAAGTGARTVQVEYIQFSSRARVIGTFTLNGTTPVTITTDGYAINSILVLSSGSGGTNAGIIFGGYGTPTAGKPANVLCLAEAGKRMSNGAVYTVPSNFALHVVASLFSPSTAPVEFEVRVGRVDSGVFVSEVVFNAEFQNESRNEQYFRVNGGDTIWVAASATGTTAGRASASLKGYLD